MTTEQTTDCDRLLRFAERCGSYERAAFKGIAPLTYSAFCNAVVMRMPEKTDEEKHYLIHFGKLRFRFR